MSGFDMLQDLLQRHHRIANLRSYMHPLPPMIQHPKTPCDRLRRTLPLHNTKQQISKGKQSTNTHIKCLSICRFPCKSNATNVTKQDQRNKKDNSDNHKDDRVYTLLAPQLPWLNLSNPSTQFKSSSSELWRSSLSRARCALSFLATLLG